MNFAPSVDIYIRPGTKIVYTDEGGYSYDREKARKKGLVKGGVYTFRQAEIGSYSTKFYIDEISGAFNSVMFSSEEEWDRYVNGPTDDDLLIERVASALERVEEGDPLKDYLDEEDIIKALKLAVKNYA